MPRSKTKKNSRRNRRSSGLDRMIRFLLTMLLLLVVVAVPALLYASYTVYMQEGVYPGVTIMGEDVGGMSRAQITAIVEEAADKALAAKSMTVYVDGEAYTVTADDMNARYDVEGAVDEAMNYCREGSLPQRFIQIAQCKLTGHEVTPGYSCDESALAAFAEELAASLDSDFAQSSYSLQGDTLQLTKGRTGRSLDGQMLTKTLQERFAKADFRDLQVSTDVVEPDVLDLNAIKTEIDIPMRNAAFDENDPSFETIISEQRGVELDLSQAQQVMDSLGEGESAKVALIVTEPEVTKEELAALLFRDVLGDTTTTLNAGNKNRTTNVRIACEKIDGMILLPGEVFSYNDTVGKRTYEAGFLDATIFNAGEKVDDVGGGICQVSSTIYMAALRADLEIVERQNHRYTVNYTPLGEDATVYWGNIDFRFRNDTDYPIRMDVKLDGSKVIVELVGTQMTPGKHVEVECETLETIDFEVVEEEDETLEAGKHKTKSSGQKGYKVVTYRVVYIDGQEVERTKEATSNYSTYNEVILVGVGTAAQQTTTMQASEQTTAATTQDNNQPPEWLQG